nr:MAG TPA: zinc-ribbon domain protein [Caudoviricetes sp.]
MTMVCDRCGEAFLLSNDVKYMTPFDDELDQFESNSIVKCLAGDDKGIYSIRDETVVLCPSCMAKLNDWLNVQESTLRWSTAIPQQMRRRRSISSVNSSRRWKNVESNAPSSCHDTRTSPCLCGR